MLFKLLFSMVCHLGLSSAQAKEVRPLDYWEPAGMSMELLLQDGFFDDRTCFENVDQFHGCFNALQSLAVVAKGNLRVLPRALVADPQFNVQKIESDFGALALVTVGASDKANEKTDLELAKEEKSARQSVGAEMIPLYASQRAKSVGDSTRLNFVALIDQLRAQLSLDKKQLALAAANMYSAYKRAELKDPHARLTLEKMEVDRNSQPDHKIFGIGAIFRMRQGLPVMLEVLPNSPADASGLRMGDVIEAIDGVGAKTLSREQTSDRLRGAEGSEVKVQIKGKGTVSIKRGPIQIDNIVATSHDLPNGKKVVRIKMRNFSDSDACQKMHRELYAANNSGAAGVILDFRSNPGGSLREAICIAGLFVGNKVIVKLAALDARGGVSDMRRLEFAQSEKMTDLPLVILQNAGSASASEVVAGALQDHHRAYVVGRTSRGKGSAQGKEVDVKFRRSDIWFFRTIQRFYRPLGNRTVQSVGVTPDFDVPLEATLSAEDEYQERESDIENSLSATGDPWVQSRPNEVRQIDACAPSFNLETKQYGLGQSGSEILDYQLFVALEVLSCVSSSISLDKQKM